MELGSAFRSKKNNNKMSLLQLLILIVVGVLAGLLAGAFGIGGAIIVIPALVFILGLSQHEAQGTSLAFMLPPVGILATWNYWKEGHVNWKIALILSITFFIGAYFGSQFSINISDKTLRRLFGGLLILIALKMIFSK
jgi:uncharacterized membrane protein YfcA